VDLDKILYVGDDIKDDLDYISIPELQPLQNGGRLNF
jgi:hypothetical protein